MQKTYRGEGAAPSYLDPNSGSMQEPIEGLPQRAYLEPNRNSMQILRGGVGAIG